ncbi:germ cell-less protein-like 1 isoform X2 [Halichondria panicea]|uniref:germ cell-less protein-like 1 isoform X2 n=1 Tax=Halichondria panicea TaxID=6063 RepID=UPI00312B6EBD
MGGAWSEGVRQVPTPARQVAQPSNKATPLSNPRKRALSEEDIEELSPKRKKIKSTSNYIYQTLFRDGINSDLTIRALGKEWKLHKVYLCQSGYFSSMFSGSWRESNQSDISLSIPDTNITPEALDVAFSSLYKDHVHVGETEVVPLVAAATMLQLDGLLEHCQVYMRENMSLERVVPFLMASTQYGLKNLKEECDNMLRLHLVKSYSVSLLKHTELLAELLSSPELYVLQVEMDVYTLAKRWLYVSLHPDWSGEMDKLLTDSDQFFREHSTANDDRCFLECPGKEEWGRVFRGVRVQHILNDVVSVRTVEGDKIIPDGWLLPLYRSQWLSMLIVDQRMDTGPSNLSTDQFLATSLRCGRVIHEPGEYCWRWTGFSFGFDVLIMYNSSTGVINVKRNTKSQPCVSAVSMQPTRTIMLRLRAALFDGSKFDTGVCQVPLTLDEEYHILTISNSSFPLYVSVNLALTSRTDSHEQSS